MLSLYELPWKWRGTEQMPGSANYTLYVAATCRAEAKRKFREYLVDGRCGHICMVKHAAANRPDFRYVNWVGYQEVVLT